MDDPELDLAISYAAPRVRSAIEALFALDSRLGAIVRATREPMVGQLRLTWWHDALTKISQSPVPKEPVLTALAAHVVPAGVSGDALAVMVEGWEVLIDPGAHQSDAVDQHADRRGATLFGLAAGLLDGDADGQVLLAGQGWALADLARHARDPAMAIAARASGRDRLDRAFARRWPRKLRPLGALAALARYELRNDVSDVGRPGAPGRVSHMLWHRLSGR
ncbi:MAG: hypothetical protein K2P68_04210 [Sphingomonas sp.]|nr:hypothetical protein [Sphingomonas sp.]